MDTRLQALAGRQDGIFTTTDAQRLGVEDHVLRSAIGAQELVRIRRGVYVDGRLWSSADDEVRYRLTAVALARTRPGEALSHHAALAVYGLPLWGYTNRIDLESDVRQVTSRRGLYLHPRSSAPPLSVAGALVVPVARAIVGTALTMGRDCAVVAGDAALHAGLVTPSELLAEVALLTPHQGRGRALDAVLLMDERCESVGESRTRLVFDDLGMAHQSQVVLRDAAGRFVARVDLLVEGVVVEFDGQGKYLRDRDEQDGQALDPGQVLWLEKRREDAIRRLGHPVERVIWPELDRPGLIGARVRSAAALVSPTLRNTPAYRLAHWPAVGATTR